MAMFPDLTDCDTVSSFAGIEKKTDWSTWNVYLKVTEPFEAMIHMPDATSHRSMEMIERFIFCPHVLQTMP